MASEREIYWWILYFYSLSNHSTYLLNFKHFNGIKVVVIAIPAWREHVAQGRIN